MEDAQQSISKEEKAPDIVLKTWNDYYLSYKKDPEGSET